MRSAGAERVNLLLQARGKDGRATGTGGRHKGGDRPLAYENVLSWQPEACREDHGGGAEDQPQRSRAVHGGNGRIRSVPEAEAVRAEQEAQGAPIFAEGHANLYTKPGMGSGHHLYQAEAWAYVPDGHHRLAQPLYRGLGTLGHIGHGASAGSRKGGNRHLRNARDHQFRPRVAVHQRRLCGVSQRPGHQAKHGRQGEVGGQREDRAVVQEPEMGKHLYQ